MPLHQRFGLKSRNESTETLRSTEGELFQFAETCFHYLSTSLLNQSVTLMIMEVSPLVGGVNYCEDRRLKVDKEDNDVVLSLRDKRFNDVITRTAPELKGPLNCKVEFVARRVLSELKAFGGTVLHLVGRSAIEGYFQSSDDEATQSK
jgi:hypothetical protein